MDTCKCRWWTMLWKCLPWVSSCRFWGGVPRRVCRVKVWSWGSLGDFLPEVPTGTGASWKTRLWMAQNQARNMEHVTQLNSLKSTLLVRCLKEVQFIMRHAIPSDSSKEWCYTVCYVLLYYSLFKRFNSRLSWCHVQITPGDCRHNSLQINLQRQHWWQRWWWWWW